MLIGYGRISTDDQNLDLQRDALAKAGCEKVFTDTLSGARADRPGLAKALSHARKGDILVVWRLDRLGRSLPHLLETVAELEKRGIGFRSLTEALDTSRAGGRFIFTIFGALSHLERDIIRERTRAGLQAARKRGRFGGRPRSMSEEKLKAARKLLSGGTPPRDVAEIVGVSLPTLYRWLPANGRAAQL
jgi:DNA invertase Pin-like site-specific DNA recombinase